VNSEEHENRIFFKLLLVFMQVDKFLCQQLADRRDRYKC